MHRALVTFLEQTGKIDRTEYETFLESYRDQRGDDIEKKLKDAFLEEFPYRRPPSLD